jgi:hypothetical protein
MSLFIMDDLGKKKTDKTVSVIIPTKQRHHSGASSAT